MGEEGISTGSKEDGMPVHASEGGVKGRRITAKKGASIKAAARRIGDTLTTTRPEGATPEGVVYLLFGVWKSGEGR